MRRYSVKRPVCTGYSLKDALELWPVSRRPRNKHCINSHRAGCSGQVFVSPPGSVAVASAPVRPSVRPCGGRFRGCKSCETCPRLGKAKNVRVRVVSRYTAKMKIKRICGFFVWGIFSRGGRRSCHFRLRRMCRLLLTFSGMTKAKGFRKNN